MTAKPNHQHRQLAEKRGQVCRIQSALVFMTQELSTNRPTMAVRCWRNRSNFAASQSVDFCRSEISSA
jgi:hypothetical protein